MELKTNSNCNTTDHSLFIRTNNHSFTALLMYVDDIMFVGRKSSMLKLIFITHLVSNTLVLNKVLWCLQIQVECMKIFVAGCVCLE